MSSFYFYILSYIRARAKRATCLRLMCAQRFIFRETRDRWIRRKPTESDRRTIPLYTYVRLLGKSYGLSTSIFFCPFLPKYPSEKVIRSRWLSFQPFLSADSSLLMRARDEKGDKFPFGKKGKLFISSHARAQLYPLSPLYPRAARYRRLRRISQSLVR